MLQTECIKTKYNSDGFRQWIHIAENDGEHQSFVGLVVAALELCSLATIGTQELPPHYPQEQSEVQPHEPKVDGRRESQVPVRVREWRGAETEAV